MGDSAVLVVGETPSLGRSIYDLLDSEGVPANLEYDLTAESPLSTLYQRFPVVIAACNEHICATARRWTRGELPNVALVVVGARDGTLTKVDGIRVISLPLVPGPFLVMVNRLRKSGARPRVKATRQGVRTPSRTGS